MKIQISAKQIHKKKQNVASYVWELPDQPDDLCGLIRMLVLSGVSEYNRRVNECQTPQPLSASRMEDLGLVGKIGFGLGLGMIIYFGFCVMLGIVMGLSEVGAL